MRHCIFSTLTAWACLAFSALACGGDFEHEDTIDEAEYGEVEQPITGASANSGSRSYGVSTGSTRPSCTVDTTGQACLVPAANKAFTYRISDGTGASGFAWTSAQRTIITNAMSSLASATGWTITSTTGTPVLAIVGISGVGSGPTSTALSAYRSWTPNGNQLTTLTDTAAGSWKSFGNAECRVDMPDITARAFSGGGSGTPTEILQHTVQNCGLLQEGVGTRSNVLGVTSAADRSIHEPVGTLVVDEQSKCLAKSRVQGVSNQFAFAGTCNK
jgi:hypothetical protein